MNITIIMLLTTMGLIFLYLLRKGSAKRKENLNIVKEGDRLHLFLSDDHFFSIRLEKDDIDRTTTESISNEIIGIKGNIRKISFVNFQNEALKNRLNLILEGNIS